MRLTPGLCPALTEEVMAKLKSAGIKTIIDFMLKDSETLARETSVSYKDLQSIRRIIHAHHAAFAVSGTDLLDEAVRSSVVISTGNSSLNSLLGGGLMTGEVVELCGGWGEGKTSLCVQLALHAALKLGLHTLFVDPSASVTPSRLAPFIEASSEEEQVVEKALSRIKITSPSDIWSMFRALEKAYHPCITLDDSAGSSSNSQSAGKLKLVVVDSLPTLVMPVLEGSRKEGLGILNQLAMTLKALASEQQIAVVVVNNVVQMNNGSFVHKSDNHPKWKPALGRYWEHVPHTRLFVERIELPEHSKILKSSASEPRENQDSSRLSLYLKVSVWKSTRLKMDSSRISLFT
ncbi:DNA repair protein RAD51 homolog 4-like [Penaeus japonicus]|uniref:DNA repair protein RAD51 homolog 4-like n=1 Tax=Penaeus japonicus TaxID=27405 RepID=UPI001C7173F0|nr:DNA repair protein RAD51 homolog 4-like [Penaeus japonicus]